MNDKTIFVCDDDQGILEMLELLLEDEGYCVVLEQNSVNALKVIARESPNLIFGYLDADDIRRSDIEIFKD